VIDVDKYYDEQVGIDPYDFFDDPQSTTRIHGGWPISSGRFVTVDYEGWGIKSDGDKTGIHLRVWKDTKLYQTIFIPLRYLLMAQAGNFELKEDIYVRNESWFAARHTKTGVWLETFKRYLDDLPKKYQVWRLYLKKAELDFLAQKFEPIKNYTPPEE